MFEQLEPQIGERLYQSTSTRIRKGSEREDGRKTFTFVISTDSEDRHGTVIDPKGIDTEAFMSNPVVLLNHDHHFVVGRALSVEQKGSKLIAVMEFDEGDEMALSVKGKVERGFMNATSIGFMVKEWTFDEENDTFKILQSELVEFSIVSVPSNRDALVLSRDASAIGALKQEIVNLREEVRKLNTPAALGFEVLGGDADTGYLHIRTTTDNTDGETAGTAPATEEDATAAHSENGEASAEDSTLEVAPEATEGESEPQPAEEESPEDVATHDETAEAPVAAAEPAPRMVSRADLEAMLERKLEKIVPEIRSKVRRSLGKE